MTRDVLEPLQGLTLAFACTVGVLFAMYVGLLIVVYLGDRPSPAGDRSLFGWHFLVPCRDEEAVIGDTIRYLRLTFPYAHVWVVDDDSRDRTAEITQRLRLDGGGDERIHLVRRFRPYARTGKGDALNAGYRALRQWAGQAVDPDRTVVVVVDADGRPAPDCLAVCAADHLFGDAKVGAVQVDVRMLNCGMPAPGVGWGRRYFGRALVRMQDLEFRVAIAAIQMSRRFTGSVAMGGNGQFTRLSALDSIAGPHGQPWRGSLLEDFELGVYLLTEGWRTRFTADTHVAQEALYSLRRFLAQRTRWDQGAMQCARHVPRIWHSPHVSLLGFAEMMYYLARPWMHLLGTLVYLVLLLLLALDTLHDSELARRWFTASGWVPFTVAGSCGLLPFLVWGPIYWVRCGRTGSPLRGLTYGAVYAMYVNLSYLTSWRALTRLLRGHNSWAKTRRNRELDGVVTIYH